MTSTEDVPAALPDAAACGAEFEKDEPMDDVTLRLRARVTILEQLTVRLFAILSADRSAEVRDVVSNLDDVLQHARSSELFGADLSAEQQRDFHNMTVAEWAWTKAQILDPIERT